MNNETGKLSFDKLFLLSGIYALFYTFCLYRNRMGLTFPVFVLGTAGLLGILLLGLNVCLTSNEIVILLDKGFIFLLFFMLFLHNLYDDSTWDVSKYILSLCGCVLSSVKFLPRPVKDLGAYLRGRRAEATSGVICRASGETSGVVCSADAKETSGVVCHEKAKNSTANAEATPEVVSTPEVASTAGHANPVVLYVLIGFGISLPLLAVVLPLLLSSDVIFQGFFKNMFDFSLEIDPGAVLFMMIVVFVTCYGTLCRFGQPIKFVAAPVADKRRYSPVIAITVNVVLLGVHIQQLCTRGLFPTGICLSDQYRACAALQEVFCG